MVPNTCLYPHIEHMTIYFSFFTLVHFEMQYFHITTHWPKRYLGFFLIVIHVEQMSFIDRKRHRITLTNNSKYKRFSIFKIFSSRRRELDTLKMFTF